MTTARCSHLVTGNYRDIFLNYRDSFWMLCGEIAKTNSSSWNCSSSWSQYLLCAILGSNVGLSILYEIFQLILITVLWYEPILNFILQMNLELANSRAWREIAFNPTLACKLLIYMLSFTSNNTARVITTATHWVLTMCWVL